MEERRCKVGVRRLSLFVKFVGEIDVSVKVLKE